MERDLLQTDRCRNTESNFSRDGFLAMFTISIGERAISLCHYENRSPIVISLKRKRTR